jgi:drug/metabolite transporter (DMT)-like permease
MSRSFYFALILLSLIWGGSFFFIKILLESFHPWTIAFLRSSFGLATIAIVMLIIREPFGFRKIPWLQMGLMAIFNTSIPWWLIALGETKLSSGMASVLNSTTPLWTSVVGVLFFKAASSRWQWVGMGVAFFGLIILLDINPVTIVSIHPAGLLFMLTATLSYAFGSQLSKKLIQSGLTMYQVSFGTLLWAAVSSGVVALLSEPFTLPKLAGLVNLSTVIGLGVFGSGFAYFLFYYLVRTGGPENATMVTYLVPVTALVWGYAILNEEIHWSLLVGLVLILGGVFLAGYRGKSRIQAAQERAS